MPDDPFGFGRSLAGAFTSVVIIVAVVAFLMGACTVGVVTFFSTHDVKVEREK